MFLLLQKEHISFPAAAAGHIAPLSAGRASKTTASSCHMPDIHFLMTTAETRQWIFNIFGAINIQNGLSLAACPILKELWPQRVFVEIQHLQKHYFALFPMVGYCN